MSGVALVTGGGRGVGRAVAEALGAAGLRVGVTARTSGELAETVQRIRAAGGTATAVVADVASPDDVAAATDRVRDELGEITLLVNNAGANRALGPSWEVDPETWWADVAVNLRGPFLCSRAVIPGMLRRGEGRIVNIVSGTATRPFPYNTAYGCSKTAVARFSDSLAEELSGTGVSVFALGPGTVRTSMATGVLGSEAGARWLGGIDDVTFVSLDLACRAVLLLASGRADALSGRCLMATENLEQVVAHAPVVIANELYQLRLRRL